MVHVVLELVPVVAQEALHRPRGGFTEGADGVTFDLAGDALEQVHVIKRGLAFDDAVQRAEHPAGAFAARGALAAGFVVVETADALAGAHHAGGFVHDDDRTRTQAGTGLLDRIVVHRAVHHDLGRQHRHRRAAGDHTLQLVAVAHAAGHFQQLGERRAEADFIVARLVDVTGHREHLGAAIVRLAQAHEPFRSIADDRRHRGIGFGVVDRGGLAVQAEIGRERRLVARLALLAFQRLHQRGFFAADIGAGAERGVDLHIDPAAQQVLAQPAVFTGFLQGVVETLERLVVELATQVVVGHIRTDRVAGDRHAFQHRMRVVAQDVAVLAGARLGFVGVAQDVLLARPLGHEAPLQAGRKTRAATAAQAGLLDHLDHLFRRDLLFEDLPPGLVAAGFQIVFVRPRLIEVQRGVDDVVFLGHRSECHDRSDLFQCTGRARRGSSKVRGEGPRACHSSESRMASIFSGVSFSW